MNFEGHSVLSAFSLTLAPPALRRITVKVNAVNGINLGQGTCQLPVPDLVKEAAIDAIQKGHNLYTVPRGIPSLRKAIAFKLMRDNNFPSLDPEREIIVTSGATGAYDAVCATLLNPGDKVVLFEPYYPYHLKTLEKYGADILLLPIDLKDGSFNIEKLESLLKQHPKLVVLANPGNPHGKVFSREELEIIGSLCSKYETYIAADETYEYLTYDGLAHISIGTIPTINNRTFTIGSYSKTFSITGWRVGYLVCPAEFADTLTGMHDLTYICSPSAFQEAVAVSILEIPKEFYQSQRLKYERKRKLLCDALNAAGLQARSPQGSYYIIADYSKRFSDLSSFEFVDHMIERIGVGAVPSDDFTRNPSDNKWVRFCYALEDEILLQASDKFSSL